MLEDRTCLNDFFKLLQTSISTDAMSAKPKLTTLCKEVTLENTVQCKTFRTLIEIKNFLHQFYQEVMFFKKMCFVFTVTFPTLKRSHSKVTWLCTKLHYTYTIIPTHVLVYHLKGLDCSAQSREMWGVKTRSNCCH